MTPDQEKEFLQWLDKEIEVAEKQAEIEDRKMEPYFAYEGRAKAFEEVKEKFLALTPPPITK